MRQADYDLVAAELRKCGDMMRRNTQATRTIRYVGREMANRFEIGDPGFNRDRFMIGAGIPRREMDRGRVRD